MEWLHFGLFLLVLTGNAIIRNALMGGPITRFALIGSATL
jgi:hypothetical protein